MLKMSSFAPHAALLFGNFLYSSGDIMTSIAVTTVPALVLSTLRAGLASIVLIAISHLSGSYPKDFPERMQIFWLALSGLIGTTASFTLWFQGIAMTTVSTAGVISVGEPVLTMIVSLSLKVETFAVYKGVALLIGVIGNIIMLALEGAKGEAGAHYMIGCFMLFFSILSNSFYLIVQMKIDKRYTTVFVQACGLCAGFLGNVVISIFGHSEYTTMTTDKISTFIWFCLIYIGLFQGPCSFTCVSYGLRRTSPVTASIFGLSMSFFNLLAGKFLLNEEVKSGEWFGGSLLLVSLVVYLWGQSRELAASEAKKEGAPDRLEPQETQADDTPQADFDNAETDSMPIFSRPLSPIMIADGLPLSPLGTIRPSSPLVTIPKNRRRYSASW